MGSKAQFEPACEALRPFEVGAGVAFPGKCLPPNGPAPAGGNHEQTFDHHGGAHLWNRHARRYCDHDRPNVRHYGPHDRHNRPLGHHHSHTRSDYPLGHHHNSHAWADNPQHQHHHPHAGYDNSRHHHDHAHARSDNPYHKYHHPRVGHDDSHDHYHAHLVQRHHRQGGPRWTCAIHPYGQWGHHHPYIGRFAHHRHEP